MGENVLYNVYAKRVTDYGNELIETHFLIMFELSIYI